MESKKISSFSAFDQLIKSEGQVYALIYKSGADQSECALGHLRNMQGGDHMVVVLIDVNETADIHPRYEITTAPSLLHFRNGVLKNIYKGCQTREFYHSVFSGRQFSASGPGNGNREKNITVYTTPSCTWCNTIKSYFRENNIRFTEIDVTANPSRAEEMVRKSGQQGVPQTEIDGQIVVGFDKQRINSLLDIS